MARVLDREAGDAARARGATEAAQAGAAVPGDMLPGGAAAGGAAGGSAAPARTAEPGGSHRGPNVLDPCCDSREVLDLVADKWSVIVVYALAGRTLRYSELQRTVGGISQKMLTQTLRRMERDGLVERNVHPVVPPRVDYALSELGATLIEPLGTLCRWAEGHMHEVHRARTRFVREG